MKFLKSVQDTGNIAQSGVPDTSPAKSYKVLPKKRFRLHKPGVGFPTLGAWLIGIGRWGMLHSGSNKEGTLRDTILNIRVFIWVVVKIRVPFWVP